jgi:hypothetical protein
MSSNEDELTEDDLRDLPSPEQRDRLRDGAFERRVEERNQKIEQINERRRREQQQELREEVASEDPALSEEDVVTRIEDGQVTADVTDDAEQRVEERRRQELRETAAEEAGERFSTDDIVLQEVQTDDGTQLEADIAESALERERQRRREEIRQEAAEDFDSELSNVDVSKDDVQLVETEDGVRPELRDEPVERQQAMEILDATGGVPVGQSDPGAAAAEVIAQSQDVNQRLVIRDALDRSDAPDDLSPSTSDPLEIARALEPEAVEASIEAFGADDEQTAPFRDRFRTADGGVDGDLDDAIARFDETVEERRQLAEENPGEFLSTVDSEGLAQLRQNVESSQTREAAEFRQRRDARQEIADQSEELDITDVEAEIVNGEIQTEVEQDAIERIERERREEARQEAAQQLDEGNPGLDIESEDVVIEDGEARIDQEVIDQAQTEAKFETRREAAETLDERFEDRDIGLGDVNVEETDEGFEASLTESTESDIRQGQREEIAQQVGVDANAIDFEQTEDGTRPVVEAEALEQTIAEDRAEELMDRDTRRILAGTERVPVGVDVTAEDVEVDVGEGQVPLDDGVEADVQLNEETRGEIARRELAFSTSGITTEDVETDGAQVRVRDSALEEQAIEQAVDETPGADSDDFVADVSREQTDQGTAVEVEVRQRDAPLFEDQREPIVDAIQDAPGGTTIPGPLGSTIRIPTGEGVEAAPEEGDAPLPEAAEGTRVERALGDAGALTEGGERISARSGLQTADEAIQSRTSDEIRTRLSGTPGAEVPGPLGTTITVPSSETAAEAPATAIDFLNPASTARFGLAVAEQGADVTQARAVDQVEAAEDIRADPTETTVADLQQLIAPGDQSGTRTQAEYQEIGQQLTAAGSAAVDSAQSDPRETTFQAIGGIAATLGGGLAVSRVRGRRSGRQTASGSSSSTTVRRFVRDERASGQIPRSRETGRSDGSSSSLMDELSDSLQRFERGERLRSAKRRGRQRARENQRESGSPRPDEPRTVSREDFSTVSREDFRTVDRSREPLGRGERAERGRSSADETLGDQLLSPRERQIQAQRDRPRPQQDLREIEDVVDPQSAAGTGQGAGSAPVADIVERDEAVSEPEAVVEEDVIEADTPIEADGVVAEETTDEVQQRQETAAEPEVVVEETVISGSETVVDTTADVTSETQSRQEQAQAPSVTGAATLERQQEDILVSDRLADLQGFGIVPDQRGETATDSLLDSRADGLLDVGVASLLDVDVGVQSRISARSQSSVRQRQRARETRTRERSRNRQRSRSRGRSRTSPRQDTPDRSSEDNRVSGAGLLNGGQGATIGSDSVLEPSWFSETLEAAAGAPLSQRSGLAAGAPEAASSSVLGAFGLPTEDVAEAQSGDGDEDLVATAAAFNLDLGDREANQNSDLFGGFFG